MQHRAIGKQVVVALAALSASMASPLPAQDVGDPSLSVFPILAISDRIRVSVNGTRIVGEVASATGEGFEFVQGGIRRSFAFREIDDLERSLGVRPIGPWGPLLPGFFAGILVKAAIDGCLDKDLDCVDGKEILLWGGGGGLLGAGAGYLIKREAWESILPGGDRVALTAAFAPHSGRDGRRALSLRGRIEF